MSTHNSFQKVSVYIDGFNMYHAIRALGRSHLKWINYRKLSESFLRTHEQLFKVYLFTSLTTLGEEKRLKNQAFLDASRAVGVDIVQARFAKTKKYCKKEEKYCKFWVEKGNDVALAVQMLADAHAGATHRMILVTADTDQIPAVQYIQQRFPEIHLSLFIPPGRKNVARDLGRLITIPPTEISAGRIEACLLPHEIIAANGEAIAMPTAYKKPSERMIQ